MVLTAANDYVGITQVQQGILNIQTVSAQGRPVHCHNELGSACDLIGLHFRSALDLLQQSLKFL